VGLFLPPGRFSCLYSLQGAVVLEIIDTFPAFLKYWSKVKSQTLDEQIQGWESVYLAPWPELLAKQIDSYTQDKLDGRQIAREKVFPYLTKHLPAFREAHKNLLEYSASLYARTQQVFNFDSNIIVLIYVGVGCGAGWATTYNNTPAILFGLENIAECDWSNASDIQSLFAHEAGHLVHQHWRGQNNKPTGSGPWWQLYEEGFAQRCEDKIGSDYSWHQAGSAMDNDWLTWCRKHKGWLAAEFLKTVENNETVVPFFGSWFNIHGRIETGYFLGHEIILELEKSLSLKEIALLNDYEAVFRQTLQQMK
jgi:hypothetical protein